MNSTLLQVNNLQMHFPVRKGLLQRTVGAVKAVDGVSFTLRRGETLSLVGESGCGKTTTGRCIVRAYKQPPTAGQILFHGTDGSKVDLAQLDDSQLKPYRKAVQMIFQDPFASLNPRMTVQQIVGEPLLVNGLASGKALEQRVAELLRRVRMAPEYMTRYPHAFSGGQRQRIGIARALATSPDLVVADEAVSALDVSVQAQILNLMQDLQAELGLTYLFVAHNLSVVRYISDRVAVMYVGKVVELTETSRLFAMPRHPYTEALLANVPQPDPRLRGRRIVLQGEVPDPANPPPGCAFHLRCSYAKERCAQETPQLQELEPGHHVACHFASDLHLRGVHVQTRGDAARSG
jgi:peptide/nickel transport system ATP-binding protein